MNAPLDHLPPQNTEAEECVLGSVLLDPSCIGSLRSILDPGDFYRERNGLILTAMYRLHDQGEPVDWTTLTDELKRAGAYESTGGLGYLSELAGVVPTAVHADHYAHIVKRCAVKRRLITAAGRMAALAYDDSTEPEQDMAACLSLLRGIKVGGDRWPIFTPEDQHCEFLESAQELADRGETGIMSGFHDLDYMTGGFEPGQLIVLIAVTSLGKSAWALSVARQMAKAGHPGLFCSVEMNRRQLEWRHAAGILGIPSKDLRHRLAKKLEPVRTGQEVHRAGEGIAASPIHLWHDPQMTTLAMRARALEWRERYKIRWLIVDYLQILSMPRAESKRVQIANVCHELKALAGEVGVPVIALCQVNRESVKARENKRPSLMDASESGSVEQDSDILMGLYRDDFFYKPGQVIDAKARPPRTCVPGKAELLVLKQRDGPTGHVDLTWRPATAEYISYQAEKEEAVPW